MSIERQLEHEAFMISGGVNRYLHNTARSEEKGAASETSYGGAFIRSHIERVSAEIEARIEKSLNTRNFPGAMHWRAIKNIDPGVLAFITLRTVIDSAIIESKLISVCNNIGKRIQDEVRLRQFEQVDTKLFNWTKDQMKQRGGRDYTFQLKSYLHGMHHTEDGKRNGMEYFKMPKEQQIQTGAMLLDATIAATGHFAKESRRVNAKTDTYITVSNELEEWIAHHKEAMSLLFPVWTPTLIPPRDWDALDNGGFYSPTAQDACEFVVTKATSDPKAQKQALKAANLSKVYSAINHLQKTRWGINTRVLEVSQQVWELGLQLGMPSTQRIEIPAFPFGEGWKKEQASPEELEAFELWKLQAMYAHTAEKERIGKSALVSRVITMANKFKDEPELYFVWHADFRGRMYSVASGLSPQGSDLGKAMLHFATGKAIVSDEGEEWFMIHGANTFGVDKVDFNDRIAWVKENKDFILRIAADPISYREWADADKPWQFLAWTFEYAEFIKQGRGYISHLPIGQDGSCNGLQHFSAMLRDEVGGAAVNLVPGDKPSDIYALVARKVNDKLRTSDNIFAHKWLEFDLGRSHVKRCVMTLPYGSTKQGAREFLMKEYMDSGKKTFEFGEVFKAVAYLTEIVWEAIGETVIAARAAMDWLQEIVKIMARAQLPFEFTLPSGWVTHQAMRKIKIKKIDTVLLGRTQIRLAEPTTQIDTIKQRNGVSPNYVHGMDASHLGGTVNACAAEGILDIAAIHDDYGTYAEDSAKLARIIREQFIIQYRENVLLNLHTELSTKYPFLKLPLPPAYGSLDLDQVLHSKYFFA